MSRFAISEHAGSRPPARAAAIAWRLALTFWVGGLWLLYFMVMPALRHYGLAPILLQDIGGRLMSLLLGLAGVCALLQWLLLLGLRGGRVLSDLRGQLLLAALLLVGGYFAGLAGWFGAEDWQLFCYLALAACGISLLLLPVPGEHGGH